MIQDRPALLLAAHGAGRPQAMAGVDNVVTLARAAFPHAEARLCLTAEAVRRALAKSAGAEPPSGPLLALAQLREEGFREVVVQPLHIFAGSEFMDLTALCQGLAGVQTLDPAHRPFDRLVVGRPALGQPGPRHPYLEDIERAARALAGDVEMARAEGAALCYAGHGNKRFSTGVYQELQALMARLYPETPCLVGALDGLLGLDHVRRGLAGLGVGKVLLVPLLLVAGGHAVRDICGQGVDSWAGALAADGLTVRCLSRGLGEVDAFARLFIDHARDAAQDAGLAL